MVEITRRDALKVGKVTGVVVGVLGGVGGGILGAMEGASNMTEGDIRQQLVSAGERISQDIEGLDTEKIEADADGVFVEDYDLNSGYTLGFKVNTPTDFTRYDTPMAAIDDNSYLREHGADVFDAVVDGYSPILEEEQITQHLDGYAVHFNGAEGGMTYSTSLSELHGTITGSDEELHPMDVYLNTLDEEHLWFDRNQYSRKAQTLLK